MDGNGIPPATTSPMTMQEYGLSAIKTARHPPGIIYPSLKLAGEVGEFVEKIGKFVRDHTDRRTDLQLHFSDSERLGLLKELGDVLWYVNDCAMILDSSLEEVARINIAKLYKRLETGTIHGSGDNREEEVSQADSTRKA